MNICPHCKLENDWDRDFCGGCRGYIGPPRPFQVDVNDVKHSDDADAIESLSAIPLFPFLVKKTIESKYPLMRKRALENTIPIFRKNYPVIYDTASYCSRVLSLNALPEIYMTPSEKLNAYTFGTYERSIIVITHGLVRLMNPLEIGAVLGHEMGHIKCEHVVYQTLAQHILSGIQVFTAGSIIFNALTSALFRSWLRAAEISADRASLLTVRNLDVVRSAHLKLAGWRGRERWDEFLEMQKTREGRLESKLLELANSHPFTAKRVCEMEVFFKSEQYRALFENIDKNNMIYRIVRNEVKP